MRREGVSIVWGGVLAGRVRRVVLLGIVIASMIGSVSASGAASIAGWSIEPSGPTGPGNRAYFAYQLQPGAQLQDTVAVTNSTDKPFTFRLYARDAFSSSGSGASVGQGQSEIAYQQESEQPTGAGSWISLPVDSYTLQAGTRVNIAFTVAVPADAPPGDHVAGIIAALVPAGQPPQSTSGLVIEQRLAARVYVRVEGDLQPAVSVGALDLHYRRGALTFPVPADATADYTIDNTGDVRLSPDVTLTLEDLAGRRIARSPTIRLAELLPGGSASGSYTFPSVLAMTRLRVRVDVVSVGVTPVEAHASATRWAVPWLLVAVAIVIGAAAVFLVLRRRAGRRAVSRP